MEEDSEEIQKEKKELKCILINHIWSYILIVPLNFIFYSKLFFIKIAYKIIFLLSSIIFISYFPVPIYPLFLLIKNKLYPKTINLFKKIQFIFLLIIIPFGILFNILLFVNIIGLYDFYKECPFNFSKSDICELYDIDIDKKLNDYSYSEKCSYHRCLLLYENLENEPKYYSYLCNYDPMSAFFSYESRENENNNEIKCKNFNINDYLITNSNYSTDDIYLIQAFYSICSSQRKFFLCDKFIKPKKSNLKYDFTCENGIYYFSMLLFGIISIIFNFGFPLSIFLYEFIKYKNIFNLYRTSNNEHGSTKNSSQIKSDPKEEQNIDLNNINEAGTIIIEPICEPFSKNNADKSESILTLKNNRNIQKIIPKDIRQNNINNNESKATNLISISIGKSKHLVSINNVSMECPQSNRNLKDIQFLTEPNNK